MSDIILDVSGLDKKYKDVHALGGISFQVRQGQIFGILGPNGSGKTTTLAILLGILKANKGTFSWFGNGQEASNRIRIGALLETPNFYPYLNAIDNLRIVAKIKNLPNPKAAIESVLQRVGLAERANSKFRSYSLGMKQRLAIASALLSDPEVLVLDEPTNGLDPMGIVDIRRLILNLKEEGKTIVIASHILDEMEKICTDVIIMRKGTIIREGKLAEITQDKEHILIHSSELQKVKEALGSSISRIISEQDSWMEFTSDLSSLEINKKLAQLHIYCDEIFVKKQSLEQSFINHIEA
ncbi:ATP-binding cassette domain-containing protein [Fluviicola sp.]|uniref:ABC transporter ATP-binding protein n=1 Tax=Fluviicola sp. TaxID=1917219 RepID=UPI0031D797B9